MVVASDLEGTLSDGATWRGFARYLVSHGRALRYRLFFLRRVPSYLLVKLGIRSEQSFRDEWMETLPDLLAGYTKDQIERIAEWVVEHELWPRRRLEVLAELEQHRQAGRRVILASGTYLPVLAAFGRRIGAEVLGTPLEVEDRAVRILLPINNGAVKAERLARLLDGDSLYSAYGDTLPDVPMLSMSAHPVVVHPDIELRGIAVRQNWRIIDSR